MRASAVLLMLLLAGTATPALAEENPRDLVALLGSPDAEVRNAASETLRNAGRAAGPGGGEVLPALREGLTGESVPVAVACADVIGQCGFRGVREDLRAVLEDGSANALLFRACCLALGRVGDYRDVTLLGSAIRRTPAAALALASIGEEDGLEPLRAALSDDSPPEIAYALVVLGDDSGVGALIAALDDGRGLAAGLYLRRIAGRDAGPERADWETWWRRERLARSLGDPDWDRSEEALAGVLARKGDDGATPSELVADLLAVAGDSRAKRDARTKAILAVGLLEPGEATPPLLDLLKTDPDGMVRVYAAEALGRIGDPTILPDLARYLIFDEEPFRKISEKGRTDAYFTIDSEVSKALVRMGVKGGLDFMIRQLGQSHRVRVYHEAVRLLRLTTGLSFDYRPDGSAAQRKAAAERWRRWFVDNREALELETDTDLDDPRLHARISELVEGLGNFHFLSMDRARQTLLLLGEVGLTELRAGLTRPEVHVRVHCAEILGWIGSKSSRGALAKALGDEKPEVRTSAAAALADMGPGEATAAVVKALEDPALDVRIEAARALARAERAVAEPALEAALERETSTDGAFRRDALYALGKLGRRDAVDRLAEMLDHETVTFRLVVAARLELLTGRDPGGEPDTIVAWREWWKVERESYSSGEKMTTPR